MAQPPASPKNTTPPQGAGTARLVVTQPRNQDGTQEETRAYEDVHVDSDGHMLLYSNRPPEDAFAFGLPLGPSESFMQVRQLRLTTPEERGITRDRDDGLCVYCQLLLLPDAPENAAHQPCMGLLIQNWDRCFLCTLINVSIGRASPDLKDRLDSGQVDVASRETRIWVRSERFDKYSLMVATMGGHPSPTVRGESIVWATRKSLGSLSRRLIWEPHSASEQGDPSARLDVIKEWLEECQSTHVACNQPSGRGDRPLPTRVLKISPQNAEIPFTVQLHETGRERAPYIALSHCWGRSNPLRTLKSNLEQHKREIAFEALPLSYGDVVVKAWLLGFQYLWIDSLCIVQDDGDDWEAEASRMADIYSGATLTFAATEAADPSQGCSPLYTRAFAIGLEGPDAALVRFQDNQDLDGERAALNTRGWAFQEAALSRRVVCFDNNQLLWKCSSKHESEDGLRAVEEATPATGRWNLQAYLASLGSGQASYAFWYRMMEDYSRRALTFETDRLPALAGIVEAFGAYVSDAPLAGLWRGDLVNGLLWRASEPGWRIRSRGVVPSWSWTSVGCSVSWEPPLFSIAPKDRLEVVSAEVEWAGRPMTSPIAAAAVRVCGRLRKAKISRNANITYLHEVEESSVAPEPGTPGAGLEEAPEVLGYCHLDLVGDVGPHVWCLEVYHGLQRQEPEEDPRNHAHRALLLEPVGESRSEFKRVGVGCLWRHSYRSGGVARAVKETFLGAHRHTVTIL